jgi:hypothetical protein
MIAIVGQNTRDIDGTFIEYDPRTFIRDIEPFDQVVYIGGETESLKGIVIDVRTSGKGFIFIGQPPDYLIRKFPGAVIYATVKDYAGPKKSVKESKSVFSTISEPDQFE